jgi:hypothetical protein
VYGESRTAARCLDKCKYLQLESLHSIAYKFLISKIKQQKLTRIIEFASLANTQPAATDDEHLFHINEISSTLDRTAGQI